jgi:hypothetical protein
VDRRPGPLRRRQCPGPGAFRHENHTRRGGC